MNKPGLCAASFSFLPRCSPCFPSSYETSASNWGGVAVASSRHNARCLSLPLSVLFSLPLFRRCSISLPRSLSFFCTKLGDARRCWDLSASDHARSVTRSLAAHTCSCHCDTFLHAGKSHDHAALVASPRDCRKRRRTKFNQAEISKARDGVPLRSERLTLSLPLREYNKNLSTVPINTIFLVRWHNAVDKKRTCFSDGLQ